MTRKLDRIAEALGLGPDAATVLAPLRALYAELDRELAARAAGLELPCKRGCDACCHESVFVSAPEVLMVIEALLATRSRAELEGIVAEMRALADRYQDELELLETIAPGAERDEVAARVRFRCPLLGAEGACTVYGARELNARTFGQSWDGVRGEAYGCTLTEERLVQLGPAAGPTLFDAREARRRLAGTLPGTGEVHVYPWWFTRLAALLLEAP